MSVTPEVLDAILICEGRCSKPTPHRFAFARLNGDVATYWYVCSVCSLRRVFGNARLEDAADEAA